MGKVVEELDIDKNPGVIEIYQELDDLFRFGNVDTIKTLTDFLKYGPADDNYVKFSEATHDIARLINFLISMEEKWSSFKELNVDILKNQMKEHD